jgi:hypothetical protein
MNNSAKIGAGVIILIGVLFFGFIGYVILVARTPLGVAAQGPVNEVTNVPANVPDTTDSNDAGNQTPPETKP